MNPREMKLAIIVGALAGVALVARLVYPTAIKPLVDIGDELATLEQELYVHQQEAARYDQALLDYKALVERTGGTDPREVGNTLHARLDRLTREAKLASPRITVRNALRDKRTGLHTVPVAITAEGSLQQTIGFLESCYELPYVARFDDLKFSPIGGVRRRGGKEDADRVKLVATMNVLVLPRDSRAPVDVETLEQPENVVKHSGESYAMIWDRLPFNRFVKEELKPPPPPKPRETVQKPEPEPEPVRPTPKGDADAQYKTVAMAMSYGIDELLVVNERSQDKEYVAKGEQLDGGQLVLVHPYGGIVRKEYGDFFYEVGSKLSDAIPVSIAVDYPEIQALARRLRTQAKDAAVSGSPGQDQPDDVDAGADSADAATQGTDAGKYATTQPATKPAVKEKVTATAAKPRPSRPTREAQPKAPSRSPQQPGTNAKGGSDSPGVHPSKKVRQRKKPPRSPLRGARGAPTTRPQENAE